MTTLARPHSASETPSILTASSTSGPTSRRTTGPRCGPTPPPTSPLRAPPRGLPEAIQEARDYAGEGIDDEDLETALAELGNLQGGSSVDLDVSANDHINPSPSITRLIEHIKTVDAYLSDAKTEIDELGSGTEVTRERVDLTSIFGGTVVTEPDELDAPIEELRSEVEALLEEDEDVEVRFS